MRTRVIQCIRRTVLGRDDRELFVETGRVNLLYCLFFILLSNTVVPAVEQIVGQATRLSCPRHTPRNRLKWPWKKRRIANQAQRPGKLTKVKIHLILPCCPRRNFLEAPPEGQQPKTRRQGRMKAWWRVSRQRCRRCKCS